MSVAEDKIGPEGLQALFDAMEVDPLDIVSLVFAWKLMAKVPFEFSRTEFVKGCTAMEVDSLEKLKAVLRKYFSTQPPYFRQPHHGTHCSNIMYLQCTDFSLLCVVLSVSLSGQCVGCRLSHPEEIARQ